MTNGDFEDEELRRLGEERSGRLHALESHNFEPARVWTMEYLLDRVKNIFCANCVHRPETQLTCEWANCDTLDRLEHRLWEVEG